MLENLKRLILILTVSCCFMNTQCEDELIDIDSDNLLIGKWVEPSYNDEAITYKRAQSLPEQGYGLEFKENGNFVERSSGWCATPPLSFFDSQGKWVLNDDIITISQNSFPQNYSLRIISVDENRLTVKRELTDQENDHKELIELFNEIYELTASVSCNDANDWSYTAYGSKACGGPQGYIAYPKQMEALILSKINTYNEAENAYNIKWNVFSTCDIPNQPLGVNCINGLPTLFY